MHFIEIIVLKKYNYIYHVHIYYTICINVTQTNMTNLLKTAASGGFCIIGTSLDDSGTNDILCDGYLTIDVNGTPYYIPLYDTTA